MLFSTTNDFGEALQALVGEKAKGLSANVVVRLKEQWAEEYDQWCQCDLTEKEYVYIWADGPISWVSITGITPTQALLARLRAR